MRWDILASNMTVIKTMDSLKNNGIEPIFVQNREEAKNKVLEIIPKNSFVMNMTSTTLDTISLVKEIVDGNNYQSIRKIFNSGTKTKDEQRMLSAAPQWAIGSVHAVTHDGKIMIASNTGSQIPAYAYGAEKVIWVVGTQKIVQNLDEGFRRIYEYCLPLESERAKIAYGAQGSSVNKILIINKEIQEGRLKLIFVNELLGF